MKKKSANKDDLHKHFSKQQIRYTYIWNLKIRETKQRTKQKSKQCINWINKHKFQELIWYYWGVSMSYSTGGGVFKVHVSKIKLASGTLGFQTGKMWNITLYLLIVYRLYMYNHFIHLISSMIVMLHAHV